MSRVITRIYVHCSASTWGSHQAVTRWHREAGLTDDDDNMGYHYLILNGFPTSASVRRGALGYRRDLDGAVVEGRPVEFTGAHVRGGNSHSIGICLIGVAAFSEAQMLALCKLSADLCEEHGIQTTNIVGHREYWERKHQTPLKSCPNFNVDWIRKVIS